MDWLEDIPGVKDMIDGTGGSDVTLPRRARVRFEGDGVEVTDDPVNGATVVTVPATPYLIPTAVKTADYIPAAGELVLVDLTSQDIDVTLTALPVGTVIGVKITTGVAHTLTVLATDSLVGNGSGAFTLSNHKAAAVFVRGAGAWYCISTVAGHT